MKNLNKKLKQFSKKMEHIGKIAKSLHEVILLLATVFAFAAT